MKYLYAQSQSQQRVGWLLESCKIKSPDVKGALSDFLVKGVNQTTAAAFNNVPVSNLSRALKRLEKQAQLIEKIKEHDWRNK